MESRNVLLKNFGRASRRKTLNPTQPVMVVTAAVSAVGHSAIGFADEVMAAPAAQTATAAAEGGAGIVLAVAATTNTGLQKIAVAKVLHRGLHAARIHQGAMLGHELDAEMVRGMNTAAVHSGGGARKVVAGHEKEAAKAVAHDSRLGTALTAKG